MRCCSASATKSFNLDAEARPSAPARPDGAHKRQPTTDDWSVSDLLPLSDEAEPKDLAMDIKVRAGSPRERRGWCTCLPVAAPLRRCRSSPLHQSQASLVSSCLAPCPSQAYPVQGAAPLKLEAGGAAPVADRIPAGVYPPAADAPLEEAVALALGLHAPQQAAAEGAGPPPPAHATGAADAADAGDAMGTEATPAPTWTAGTEHHVSASQELTRLVAQALGGPVQAVEAPDGHTTLQLPLCSGAASRCHTDSSSCGGGSHGQHSPRHCSRSASWEAEASKRYSGGQVLIGPLDNQKVAVCLLHVLCWLSSSQQVCLSALPRHGRQLRRQGTTL